MVLYVGMALALSAAVGPETMSTAGASLLVSAARSQFGEIGYYILLLTAIAGTTTCLNGGLFGAANITYSLAEKGQLPPRMMRSVQATTRGLLVTSAIAIILVFLFDLSSVASLGAATSLMVYLLVNIGALKLLNATGLRLLILRISVASCAAAILIWVVHAFRNTPEALGVFAVFLFGAVIIEALLQRVLKRRVDVEVSERQT